MMKLLVKVELVKFIFLVVNVFFLALGTSVAACGVWIRFDSSSFIGAVSSEELQMVGVGLLLIGILVMVSGMVACFGACWEKRLFLLAYVCFLLLLILGQLLVLLLLLVNKRQIEEHADTAVGQMILRYVGTGRQDRLLDNMQHHEACCGLTGSSDWLQNSFIQTLNLSGMHVFPCSCFSSHQPTYTSPWCSQVINASHVHIIRPRNHTHEQGCREKLRDWLQVNIVTMVAMDVTLMVIQVLQLALAAQLYRSFGQKTTNEIEAIDHTPLSSDMDNRYGR
ncbi:CD82 antigen isoform X1 [Dunckerocampus dactyliophorus]|uniref:CD82 antigen isoform X1 n=1 Tax=Dunckerocampus dactyliophorus TaxID=161453 RepID=UPI00240685DE|nr:CD82 antigen isoform X1 [Dunckerocampus dactyliophorus]